MSELLELAARAEAASPASRRLDAAIHASVAPEDFDGDAAHYRSVPSANHADLCYFNMVGVPAYTNSTDAALTLVPEGYHPSVVLRQAVDNCIIEVGQDRAAFIKRLPAFVSAAALRARAAQQVQP